VPWLVENEGYAEDLTEGKFSFPIIHGIRKDQENRQILSAV
jgi:geranylgeranyl diphosphate synthase type 3